MYYNFGDLYKPLKLNVHLKKVQNYNTWANNYNCNCINQHSLRGSWAYRRKIWELQASYQDNPSKVKDTIWGGSEGKKIKLPPVQETWVWALGWEDPLEKGMATYSSILAWRIPRTEKPGGLQPMGSQKVRHDWGTNTLTFS